MEERMRLFRDNQVVGWHEKALVESCATLEKSKTKKINREKLIEQLKKDSEKLFSEPGHVREILHTYICKIIIADDTVTVTVFGDYVSISNSPSRTRTYNLSVNSRVLYH